MGESNCWEREVVITEMTKGKELMLQLQKYLDIPTKQDACQYLAREILSSYDKALSLLKGTALSEMMMISKGKQTINPAPSSSAAPQLQSPHPLPDSSTKSSHRSSNSRKRKMLARRTEYVKARSGEVVPPEDGYSWRKYGQKTILGAKYPREYYRCVQRHLCSCWATKIVQQSETEPLAFEVTYGGSHSCGQEKRNQQGKHVLTKETQCDEEVEIAPGKTSEFDTPEMVSTPNNSFNNNCSTGVVSSNSNSATSSPYPDSGNPFDCNPDFFSGLVDAEWSLRSAIASEQAF